MFSRVENTSTKRFLFIRTLNNSSKTILNIQSCQYSQALTMFRHVLISFVASSVFHTASTEYFESTYDLSTAKQLQIDEENMRVVVNLAKDPANRFPFAASIVDRRTNKLLCTGVNSDENNPTLHGEIVAINNCSKLYGYNKDTWHNYTLYTTGESCPMCQSGKCSIRSIHFSNI